MPDKNLLTKEQIASELSPGEPLSIRSVERYIKLASVKPAPGHEGSGRGRVAMFARGDVEKIKAAFHLAAQQREEQREAQSTALTTTKPALPAVALVEELRATNQSLLSALDTWPVWLTRADALTRTGLPASWFDAGVTGGELAHVGEGRGRRFYRDDVRRFAEAIRDADYLAQLLKPKARKARKARKG